MSIRELWKFISDNAEALVVLLTLATFLGSFIGFSLKVILERFTKSNENKKHEILKMQNIISNLENECSALKNELSQYNSVIKSDDGETLTQVKTATKICPICWNNNKKAIPVYGDLHGNYKCTICNHIGVFDFKQQCEYKKRQDDFINQLNTRSSEYTDYYNKNGWF